MNRKLESKIAVVTGGSAGIGFGAAKRFADEGVQNPHSLLNCRLSEETLRNRANNLRLSYQALQFRRCAAEYISRVQIPCSFLEKVSWSADPNKTSVVVRLNYENHAPLTLSGLCLVPTIREAVTRFAQVRLIGSGSCRRFFLGNSFSHRQGKDERGASRGSP